MKAWRLAEVTIGGSEGGEVGWEGSERMAWLRRFNFSATLGRAATSFKKSLPFLVWAVFSNQSVMRSVSVMLRSTVVP